MSQKKWWSPQKPVKFSDEDKISYQLATDKVKEVMIQKLGVNIGNPGNLVEGNAFKSFSSDFAREVIGKLVNDDIKDGLKEVHLRLCVAVKVVNSQKRQVNVAKFREMTKLVYMNIVELFPWAVVSPSVHHILGHAWERIEQNDGYGLGNVSEEGLEALNKWICRFR